MAPREFLWTSTPALKSSFLSFWILASSILLSLANRRIIHQGQFPDCSGYEAKCKARPTFSRLQLGKLFFYYLKYICYEKSDRFLLNGGNWCGSMPFPPPPPPGGHFPIWPIRVCAAEQGMVFMLLSLKQGIWFHYWASWTGCLFRPEALNRVWILAVCGLRV